MQRIPRMLRRLAPRWYQSPALLPTTSRVAPVRLTTPARSFGTSLPLRNTPNASLEPPANAGVTARLKYMMKAYGLYAIGVYFALGAVDFAIAFAAINVVGADHVSRFTAIAKAYVMDILGREPAQDPSRPVDTEPVAVGSESLWAMIILAYTVHKTLFLPFRAGLTVALTPRLVKYLQAKGWAGSAGAKRAATQMRERLSKNNRD